MTESDLYTFAPNIELTALNQIPLPSSDSNGKEIRYTIIYSGSEETYGTWTWSNLGGMVWPGDGTVTSFSALGYLPDMNVIAQQVSPTVSPRIVAFQGIAIEALSSPGKHIRYIEIETVMSLILQRLCSF